MSLRAGDMNKGPLKCHCEPKAKQSQREQGIASVLTHLAMTGGVSLRAEGVAIPDGAGDCFGAYAARNDRREQSLRATVGSEAISLCLNL